MRLSNFECDLLRPGEKLHEELLIGDNVEGELLWRTRANAVRGDVVVY